MTCSLLFHLRALGLGVVNRSHFSFMPFFEPGSRWQLFIATVARKGAIFVGLAVSWTFRFDVAGPCQQRVYTDHPFPTDPFGSGRCVKY